jgi:hypothetical protein
VIELADAAIDGHARGTPFSQARQYDMLRRDD